MSGGDSASLSFTGFTYGYRSERVMDAEFVVAPHDRQPADVVPQHQIQCIVQRSFFQSNDGGFGHPISDQHLCTRENYLPDFNVNISVPK